MSFDIGNISDDEISKMSSPDALIAQAEAAASKEELNKDTPPANQEENLDPGQQTLETDPPSEEDLKNQENDLDNPPKTEEEIEKPTTTSDDDPQSQLARIFAPFTANGKQIKVESVDDVIRLMQMGAGFNKKMANVKSQVQIAQLLDSNGIKREDLDFLIDLHKGKPEAVGKLLAKSNIDPLNLGTGSDYTPTTYTVDETEFALKDVLDDLKEGPGFNQMIDFVSNKLDESSKRLLLSDPENLRVLNEHMSNGTFQKIMDQVELDRALGKLKGLPDIEAYRQVGAELHAKGAFGKPKENPKATVTPPKKPEATDIELKNRKLAASPTKSVAIGKKGQQLNPLALSDADIANMSFEDFINS